MPPAHRQPAWSDALTRPLAARIPSERRVVTLRGIKAFHSAAFFSIAAMVILVAADGARGRPGRRTGAALTVALAETVVYASNNQVCPLSPLAEELGAESGSVTDIYLPGWLSERIPVIFGTILAIGLTLDVRAWLAGRRVFSPGG
jgi:hypothetical protein